MISNLSTFQSFLASHALPSTTVEHDSVFTVDALMKCAPAMPGHHHKNLFLKAKKDGQLYLLVARHDAEVNLNKITALLTLKNGSIRFASEELLFDALGVRQGSVTIYGLANDAEKQRVILLLDDEVLEDTADDTLLWFHPMQNDASTGVTAKTLSRFLEIVKHCPIYVNLK